MLVCENFGISTTRSVEVGSFCHAFCSASITGHHCVSLKEVNYLFPLWLAPEEGELKSEVRPNISQVVLRHFGKEASPDEIFLYTYSVFHSPSYRSRYAKFLKIDFPRLPLTGNLELFRTLAHLGGELVSLHLMHSTKLDQLITTYNGPKNPEVGQVGWSNETVWLDAAATKKGQPIKAGTREGHIATVLGSIGFKGVPKEVWNFHIDDYQVCEKWLKDRKGRTLPKDDIAHYQKIVVAINETIRIMREIDEVIDLHGGWPEAFAGRTDKHTRQDPIDKNHLHVSIETQSVAAESTKYKPMPIPLLKVAEPEAPLFMPENKGKPREERVNPADLEIGELICIIRQLFGDGSVRERDAVIGDLGKILGYQRTIPRVKEELESALRIAVRRGVLETRGDGLAILLQRITDYDRDFLKGQFLSSLTGRRWVERADAYRLFARWMGFRRTGRSIEETAKSLVNGLIRDGRIESDGSRIRRCE
ncbi:MAG: hypothetical protein A2W33_01260 [Chloroflexi bacterium RBG_16_52_11]|nr:MAG: hypothetical protein A2W33_01260 [Chloroflexi bacterium RBG_16_52_11]